MVGSHQRRTGNSKLKQESEVDRISTLEKACLRHQLIHFSAKMAFCVASSRPTLGERAQQQNPIEGADHRMGTGHVVWQTSMLYRHKIAKTHSQPWRCTVTQGLWT